MLKKYSMTLCGLWPSPESLPQTALFGCDEPLLITKMSHFFWKAFPSALHLSSTLWHTFPRELHPPDGNSLSLWYSKLLEGRDTLQLTFGSLTPRQMNSVFWAFSFLIYKMRKIEMALLLWGLSDKHKPTNPVSSSVSAFGTTAMKIKFSKSINISPPIGLQQHYVERQMPQLSQSSW